MKRKNDEILAAYYNQRKAIASSCRAYDRGAKWEAARLATSVVMMVHDAGNNRSILSHSGSKEKFPWVATGREVTDRRMSRSAGASCLIELDRTKGGELELVPLCTYQDRHDVPLNMRFLSFNEWWEKDIIAFESELSEAFGIIDTRPPLLRRGMPPLLRGIHPAIAEKIAMDVLRARPQPAPPLVRGWLTRLTRKKLVLALRNQDGGSHFDPELRDPNYRALKKPLHFYSFPDVGVCGERELATMRQIAEELRITLLLAGATNRGDLPRVEFFWTEGDKKKWKKFCHAKEIIDELNAWKR